MSRCVKNGPRDSLSQFYLLSFRYNLIDFKGIIFKHRGYLIYIALILEYIADHLVCRQKILQESLLFKYLFSDGASQYLNMRKTLFKTRHGSDMIAVTVGQGDVSDYSRINT